MIENNLYRFSIMFVYISFTYTAMYTRRLLRIILRKHMRGRLNIYFSREFSLYSALKNSFTFIFLIVICSKLIVLLLIFEECFVVEVSGNEKNFTFTLLTGGLGIGLLIDKFLKRSQMLSVFWSFSSIWFMSSRLTFFPLIVSKSLIQNTILNIDRFFLPNVIYELLAKSIVDRFSVRALSKSKFYLISLFFMILVTVVAV